MFIEQRIESIEKTVEEIKNILLHRVVPIEAMKQAEEVQKEPKPKSTKPKAEPKQPELPVVIGLIDNTLTESDGSIKCVKISSGVFMNPNTGKEDIKYSFLIVTDGIEKRYGTWDSNLAKQVMECIDNRRLVRFEYKERLGGKDNKTIFNDIISFREANTDEVKI